MSLFHTPENLQVTEISLNVHQLDVMVQFYTQQLGFTILFITPDEAILGVPGRSMIHLYRIDRPQRIRSAGLYHVAILLPSRDELASFFTHAMSHQLLDGASDHGVSEALYLTDPEGNGIEVYVDRPVQEWPIRNGALQMVSDPLKARELSRLATLPFTRFSDQTRIGHLHLHVMDIAQSEAFYHQLGFDVMQHFGDSASFLGHQGYHHHIGMNTWLGRGIAPRPELAVGLRLVTLSVPPTLVEQLRQLPHRMITSNILEMTDPNGIVLQFILPS